MIDTTELQMGQVMAAWDRVELKSEEELAKKEKSVAPIIAS